MKFKASLIGYLILASFCVYGIYRVESLTRALNNQTRTDCVDRSGDRAFRHQDEKIVQIIKDLNEKQITPKQGQQEFIQTYTDALKEAGPLPECIGTK